MPMNNPNSIEFRGVVNIDLDGEVVCFCSQEEALRGKCICQKRDNCPEAIISIEIIQGSRLSERSVKQIIKTKDKIGKNVIRIKEGLSRLEQAVKKNNSFRL